MHSPRNHFLSAPLPRDDVLFEFGLPEERPHQKPKREILTLLLIALLFWTLFAILDARFPHRTALALLSLRFGYSLVLMGALAALFFTRKPQTHYQFMASSLTGLGEVLVLFMMFCVPDSSLPYYFAGLLMCYFYGIIFARLNVVSSLWNAALTVLPFGACILLSPQIPGSRKFALVFIHAVAKGLGLSASIMLDTAAQKAHDMACLATERQRRVEAVNNELEERVRERTDELESRIRLHRETENHLRTSRQKIRKLSQDLITAQEEERSRLARELHDNLTRELAFLKILCEQPDREKNAVSEGFRSLILSVRDMAHNLEPHMVRDNPFHESAIRLCEEYTRRHGTPVTCDVREADSAQIPRDLVFHLFRILQEALTNTAKHARASHIRVRVAILQNMVTLEVHDDGIGFDATKDPFVLPSHMGLRNMDARANLMGGSAQVRSAPGDGTLLQVSVPLRATA